MSSTTDPLEGQRHVPKFSRLFPVREAGIVLGEYHNNDQTKDERQWSQSRVRRPHNVPFAMWERKHVCPCFVAEARGGLVGVG